MKKLLILACGFSSVIAFAGGSPYEKIELKLPLSSNQGLALQDVKEVAAGCAVWSADEKETLLIGMMNQNRADKDYVGRFEYLEGQEYVGFHSLADVRIIPSVSYAHFHFKNYGWAGMYDIHYNCEGTGKVVDYPKFVVNENDPVNAPVILFNADKKQSFLIAEMDLPRIVYGESLKDVKFSKLVRELSIIVPAGFSLNPENFSKMSLKDKFVGTPSTLTANFTNYIDCMQRALTSLPIHTNEKP